MADLQELRRLAEEAAAENDVESDWFDPVLIESVEPVLSSRKARRFIAAMTPQMAMRLILLADRAHGAGVDDTARLNMVLDTFGKREDNMPLTAAERGLIVAFTDRGSHTKGMKLSAIDDAVRAAEMEGRNNG